MSYINIKKQNVTITGVQTENTELKNSTTSQIKPEHILTCTIVLLDQSEL